MGIVMSGVLMYQRVLATAIAVLLFGADSLPSAPVIIDFEALPDGPPCQRTTRFILAHG